MPLSRELAALWEAQPEEQRPPGAAVAAAAGGETVYAAGFGARDAAAGLPATPDTVFGVASVAKPFTALAVLLLAERGVLSVADPVRTWLPELRLPRARSGAATVTIHHLLTHTSGLPPEVALPHARARDMLGDPDLDRLGLSERQRSRLGLMQQRGELIDTYEELIERLAEADVPALGQPDGEGVLEVHLSGRALPCRPVADDGMVVYGPELHVRFLLRGGRAWALFDGARVSRRDPSD